MWEWITVKSVWLFLPSAFILLLFLLFRDKVLKNLSKVVARKQPGKETAVINIFFWAIEGLLFLVSGAAFTALLIAREEAETVKVTETVQNWILEHGLSILIISLVGVGLWYLIKRLLPPMLRRAMEQPRRGESKEGMKRRAATLISVFLGISKIIVVLMVVFTVLSELNVPIGPVLAGFGIAGIAVGFGAQYLIRDLIAGIFILIENQYRVGDVARVADIAGLVEEITLRKTVLRDLDGIVHHVPNGEIKVASNFSRHFSRVNLNISVSYGTDLDHAISVINRVCQEMAAEESWHESIKSVPQVLRVDKLGDSGIDIKILGDVKPLQQWAVMGELRLRLKKAFDAEGIEIPWPHTKVYFGNAPGQ